MSVHDQKLAAAFDAQAERFERAPVQSDPAALARLVQFADLPPDQLILDAGCGPGLVCGAFLEAGHRLVGVDLSSEERQQPSRPTEAFNIRIEIVTDGRTWERNLVHDGVNSCISLWVSGLPEGATKAGVAVRLGGNELPAVFLSETDPQGLRQINAMRPSGLQPGEYAVAVGFQGAMSEAVPVRLL